MAKQTKVPKTTTTTETNPGSDLLDQALDETEKRVQSVRHTAAKFLGVPPEKVAVLLQNVWSTSNGKAPLTEQEMFQGMSMIARFGLDPIAKEVYVTRTKQGLATIIGIDGWIKVLDRTDHYDGHEQEIEFSEDGKVFSVTTKIHSKTRKYPTVYVAYASEYATQSGFVAGNMPIHMLRIFSLRHAARQFTPIGGSVVTEEEAHWMDAYDEAEKRNGNKRASSIPRSEPKDEQEPTGPEQPEEEPHQDQAEEPARTTSVPRSLRGLDDDLLQCKTKADLAALWDKRHPLCKDEEELNELDRQLDQRRDALKQDAPKEEPAKDGQLFDNSEQYQ